MTGLEPCPPIEQGPGTLVTGTIRSESMDLRKLKLVDLDEPIGVTGNHLIFSEDREAFTPVCELMEGERLRTLTGAATVERIEKLPGRYAIFNLEIDYEHQYYASKQQVLVHNVYPDNGVAPKDEAA